jgi:hypothetical protein
MGNWLLDAKFDKRISFKERQPNEHTCFCVTAPLFTLLLLLLLLLFAASALALRSFE